MLRSFAIPLLALLFVFSGTCLAGETVGKGPAPGWVDVAPMVYPEEDGDDDSSVRHLLVDYQEHREELASHHAYAKRLLTTAGVEDFSQISAEFQPTFQDLVWNSLVVIRDGEQQDRLAAAEFQVIQREGGMESQLYDGELTAHVILSDIRPGDIIAYSYTIIGENPIFGGRTHGFMKMSFGSPVDRIRRSVTWDPEARALGWQIIGGELEMKEETLAGGLRRISYDGLSVPETETEPKTPGWFLDYAYLESSDYADWAEFGKWANDIYRSKEPLPPAIAGICDGILAEGGSDSENAVKVLRWVQGNIRYLGSFFGAHTHAPYTLAQIDTRRFGDCKDKGMLTVAMLRHIGLDAAPALVDTASRGAISDGLPGHSNFNHLIVHLRLGERDYWLDPTRAFQRGTLENQYLPDYGLAFVIREGADKLTPVQPSGFAEISTTLHEIFDITDEDGNGTLTVRTVATGVNADGMRRTFATDSRSDLEEDYRSFYEQDYPGIEVAAPLTVADDAEANRLTITEHYRLKDFFTMPTAPGGEATASVYARSIADYFSTPDSKARKNPWRISHPVNYTQTIDITIPKTWDISGDPLSADLPSLAWSYEPVAADRRLTLTYRYKTLADHVGPAGFPDYRQAMIDATDSLFYEFYYPLGEVSTATNDPESLAKSRILLGALFVFGCLIGLAACIAFHFWDPPARETTAPGLAGLGGWLVLPMIGCFLLPILILYVTGTFFQNISPDGIDLFGGGETQGKWQIYYGTAVLAEGLQFPLSIFQLYLLMKRRTSFPYFYVGFAVLMLGDLCLNSFLQTYANADIDTATITGEITQSVIKLGIWGTYMFASQRVRATFTVRRKKPTASPPPLHTPGQP